MPRTFKPNTKVGEKLLKEGFERKSNAVNFKSGLQPFCEEWAKHM